MPIFELIIAGALAISYVTAAVYMVFLTFTEIVSWFASRRSVSSQDRTRLAFTLQDMVKNGRYRTVQGVFNTATGQVETDARKLISNSIDSRLTAYHGSDRLVIYP